RPQRCRETAVLALRGPAKAGQPSGPCSTLRGPFAGTGNRRRDLQANHQVPPHRRISRHCLRPTKRKNHEKPHRTRSLVIRHCVACPGAMGRLRSLRSHTDDSRYRAADRVAALTYNASGLYHTVGETFSTPAGATVRREPNQYKPFAAVNESTANYITVSTNSAARRVELKAQIAQTTDQLRAAQTDAE